MHQSLPQSFAVMYVTVMQRQQHNPEPPEPATPATMPAPLDPEPPAAGIDQQPAAVYLSTLAPSGRRGMHTALRQAADVLTGGRAGIDGCPWHRLGAQHLAAIKRQMLDSGAAPATVNRMLSALRGVLKACWQLGLIDSETLARARSVAAVKARRLPAGRHVAAGEVAALFRACGGFGPVPARDAALLALLYGCGLRRAEAVALDLAHYAADTGAVTVTGKGGHQRQVFATNGARAALAEWRRHRGEDPGALLLPVAKGGRIQPGRMSAAAVWARLQTLAKRAGVQPFTPHDLRRSFVGELLDAGADVVTVQALAGHANVQTTARYDRRGERAQRSAADRLHVPYVPPPEV